MDLRKLEYLEAVYRLKSFTKAAKEQYVSQSSISEAIMRLEEEMGAVFIRRGEKPVTFTPAGEVFIQYVYRILSMAKTAREEVSLSVSRAQAGVPFAWAGKFEDLILCELNETFARDYPQYALLPREGTSSLMLEQILKDEIEFAYLLIPEEIDASVFHCQPLQCSILSAAIAKTNPLSQRKTVPLELLLKENLYIPPAGARLRSGFDELAREQGLGTQKLQVIPPFQIQRMLAKRNSGIYLTTRDDFGESSHDPDFNVVPIENAPVFSKGIITRKGRQLSAGAQTAITRILEIVQEFRIQS
ncbi:MAG: LysR family transcriptional regulator [Lachnospiraceae bacterium]|nr:LysR family transcriptional regulator [Lachnospiraceae bacterium]